MAINETGASGNCPAYVNNATATGHYMEDDKLREVVDRDTAIVDCIRTELEKSASVTSAQQGDVITYTIKFTNRSSLPLAIVRISDDIPAGTTLVAGSIRPTPQQDETLQSGVSVGSVLAGASVSLVFRVTVNENPPAKIVNHANAEYFFKSARGEDHSGSVGPVVNTIDILGAEIAITKAADKSFVIAPGEEIQYTLTVTNPGGVLLTDVTVTDEIPMGLAYKVGSTSLNGGARIDRNPAYGIPIGSLSPGATYTVEFILIVQ